MHISLPGYLNIVLFFEFLFWLKKEFDFIPPKKKSTFTANHFGLPNWPNQYKRFLFK